MKPVSGVKEALVTAVTSDRFYTGVGSRETPPEILVLMEQMARYLALLGWRLRSGCADGADQAFQRGAVGSIAYPKVLPELYLPWNGFRYSEGQSWANECKGFINTPELDNYEQALSIILAMRPDVEHKRGPRALHTRNVYQVLGRDLATPSRKLICWAEPAGRGHNVRGGTNTAVQLARRHNVPVLNLCRDEDRLRAEKFLQQYAFLDEHLMAA